MSDITVSIDKKKKTLTIVLPMEDSPQLSASGKNYTLASTRGNHKSSELYNGKPITIGVNAYIPAK